jgi:SsrA-binding protein
MSRIDPKNSKGDARPSRKAGDGAPKTIALNKAARHDFSLGDRFEAGIALQGWELKAIRAGRLGIGESYALVKGGEIFLFGAQITPLISASTHVIADDRRTRKLLLHRNEIDKLVGRVEREGYTLVPTAMLLRATRSSSSLRWPRAKKSTDKRETEEGTRLAARKTTDDAQS